LNPPKVASRGRTKGAKNGGKNKENEIQASSPEESPEHKRKASTSIQGYKCAEKKVRTRNLSQKSATSSDRITINLRKK